MIDEVFVEQMKEIFLHELNVMPARLKDSKGIFSDMPDYRFEYLIDPDELPEVGLTPKDVLYEDNKMKLYRYKSDIKKKYKTPLLFIYALINKPYILDLQPGNSFIEYWLDLGYDVYLIDWGIPGDEDRLLEFDTIIADYMDTCVDIIRETTGQDKINMFGWCIGGNLAMIYTALFADKIKNLVLLTTPFDPTKGGLIQMWADENVFHLKKIVDVYGNMPAKFIRYGVITVYPFREFRKNAVFYDNIKNKYFLQAYALAEKWINDYQDIPGKAFQKYIEECFQTTNLLDEKTVIDGNIVKLSNINMPVLNIAAEEDHIVTNESTKAFEKYHSSKDYTFKIIEGGHVGLAYDPRTRAHWPEISKWLNERSDKI